VKDECSQEVLSRASHVKNWTDLRCCTSAKPYLAKRRRIKQSEDSREAVLSAVNNSPNPYSAKREFRCSCIDCIKQTIRAFTDSAPIANVAKRAYCESNGWSANQARRAF
jgi:hypothetical protein